jgi:DNA-binding NarL/FixJ family response regulator
MKRQAKINLLIVDDHYLIRQGLKLILSSQKELEFNVNEVDSGEKAIEFWLAKPVDIALMDITMTGMSGIETTKKIKSIFPSAKIIGLTMHNEVFMIKKMIEAGASGFLLKDSDANELISAIKCVLNGQKYLTNEASLKMMGMYDESKRQKHNEDLPKVSKLTSRELDVLKLIAQEFTTLEIAIRLNIADRTAEFHRRNILEKLELKNTAGLIVYAIKNKLIEV